MKNGNGKALASVANILQGGEKNRNTGVRHLNDRSSAYHSGFIFIEAVMQSVVCSQR